MVAAPLSFLFQRPATAGSLISAATVDRRRDEGHSWNA